MRFTATRLTHARFVYSPFQPEQMAAIAESVMFSVKERTIEGKNVDDANARALNAQGSAPKRPWWARRPPVDPPPVQRAIHPATETVSHLGEQQHLGAPSSGGGMGLPANLLVPGPPAREG